MDVGSPDRMMNSSENVPGQHPSPRPRPRWRRAFVASSLVFAILGTGIICAPAVVTQTGIRNQILASSFTKFGLTSLAESASGSWTTAVAFHGVELKDSSGRTVCRIKEIRTSKGLLGFLAGDGDLGQLTIVEPDTEIHLSDDGSWPLPFPATPSAMTCGFTIEEGRFRLVVPWRPLPIVELSGLNISGRVLKDEAGQRRFTVDAFQLFDHEPISEKHAQQNLALIAPVLSQSTRLGGSVSVWVSEISMPLDEFGDTPPTPFPINGYAKFHSLEAQLKSDWVRQLTLLTGQLAGKQLPDRLEMARNSEVHFSVTKAGIHHEGMTFLLPELANGFNAQTSGLIGLDESLDLLLTVSLPKPDSSTQSPAMTFLSQLTSQPVQLVVKGTVSDPELQAAPGFALLDDLSRRIAPPRHSEQSKPVTQAVFELIQGVSQPEKEKAETDLPGGIFNLIRSIKAEKDRKKKAEN